MDQFNLKLPEGMLERWREVAEKRGTTLAQLIREAVNRDIEEGPRRPEKPAA